MIDIHEINISLSFLQDYIWIIAGVGRFLQMVEELYGPVSPRYIDKDSQTPA
jgi:hypothetical protein